MDVGRYGSTHYAALSLWSMHSHWPFFVLIVKLRGRLSTICLMFIVLAPLIGLDAPLGASQDDFRNTVAVGGAMILKGRLKKR